jgi:hypothetical protein
MTLCDRLIGGAVDGLMLAIDTIASFWQTPREVEWAKAAADGLAEREAEVEEASRYVGRLRRRCLVQLLAFSARLDTLLLCRQQLRCSALPVKTPAAGATSSRAVEDPRRG